MEINFQHRTETIYQEFRVPDKWTQITIESVVPDVSEDIGRIVTVKPTVMLKSKERSNTGLAVGGLLSLVLLYIGEESERLSCVRMQKEFQLNYELDGLEEEQLAHIQLKLGNAEARVVNPRKVSVTVEVRGELSCFRQESLVTETSLPEDCAGRLYVKGEHVEATVINAVCEKSFALNEQYRFREGEPIPAELLAEGARLSVESMEQVGSRVVLKGRLWTEIWYLSDESSAVVKTEFNSPFSQIIDTGAEECVNGTACLCLTNTYFDLIDTISGDKALDVEIHAILQLVSRAEQGIDYLSDAYSNQMTTECSSRNLAFTRIGAMQRSVFDVEQEINLGDDCREVLGVFPALTQISLANSELNAQMNLDLSCRGPDGTPNAARRTAALRRTDLLPGTRLLDARILRAETGQENGSAVCKLSIEIVFQLEQGYEISMLDAVHAEEETRAYQDAPSLCLVHVGEEELWDLAKEYHSSIRGIEQVNELEYPLSGRLLLIPRES